MTDLEMTRLCAEAMGYRQDRDGGYSQLRQGAGMDEPAWFEVIYYPLHDDAQAMTLLKWIRNPMVRIENNEYRVYGGIFQGRSPNLNRAIVECAAKLQAAKAPV